MVQPFVPRSQVRELHNDFLQAAGMSVVESAPREYLPHEVFGEAGQQVRKEFLREVADVLFVHGIKRRQSKRGVR